MFDRALNTPLRYDWKMMAKITKWMKKNKDIRFIKLTFQTDVINNAVTPIGSSKDLLKSAQRLIHSYPESSENWVLLATMLQTHVIINRNNGKNKILLDCVKLALTQGKMWAWTQWANTCSKSMNKVISIMFRGFALVSLLLTLNLYLVAG